MAKRKKKVVLTDVEKGLPKYIEEKRNTPQINNMKTKEIRICPRCKGFNTIATSTQTFESFTKFYRVCRSSICRHRYCRVEML